MAILLSLHALLWVSIPLLFIDGMHVDTLEMAAWGRDWALGYPKHPPLGTWMVAAALRLPGLKIFNILVLSQLCIAATAIFIWKAVRLHASSQVAGVAVILFLETAAATIFSVQLNHNLISMPFEAALLFFGLTYLERPSVKGAVAVGLAAGLASLAKYETALFHLTLLLVALTNRRYRPALVNRRFALAAVVSLLVVAPHLYWTMRNGWPTFVYATSARSATSAVDYLISANNFLVGILTLLLGPALTLMAYLGFRKPVDVPRVSRDGILLAATPFVLLAALSLLTTQIIRQGWLLPLAPALFIGLAQHVPAPDTRRHLNVERLVWCAFAVSVLQAVGFAGFIVARSWLDRPIAAYALDSSELSEQILDDWRKLSPRPLDCIAVPNATRSLAMGPVLYIKPEPKFVVVNTAADLRAACPGGGLALIPLADTSIGAALKRQPGEERMSVASETGVGSSVWTYRVFPLAAR